VSLDKSVEFDFNSCWFSNRPGNGLTINECENMRFTGGAAFNCAQHGVLVQGSATHTTFNGFTATGNGTQTTDTFSGIITGSGASDFVITGCRLGGSLSFGTQSYGLTISSSADQYTVTGNDCTGNGTGGINDAGGGSEKYVKGNLGHRTEQDGSFSTTTNAFGDITITHSLSATPTKVIVNASGTTFMQSQPHTITSSQFLIRLFDAAGAGLVTTAVAGTWEASV